MKTNQLPKIRSYGNYSSDNYGLNTLEVILPKIDLYFSYRTIVAFSTIQTGLVVSKNNWSTTTGKHLNWIDGGRKSSRLPSDQFAEQLSLAMKTAGISE